MPGQPVRMAEDAKASSLADPVKAPQARGVGVALHILGQVSEGLLDAPHLQAIGIRLELLVDAQASTEIDHIHRGTRWMDLLARIGGKRIAAPPAGATREPGLNLDKAAERYRQLLELGDRFGVVPQIEVWGLSKNLHRLGQSMYVVIESGHPRACLLPDVFHIYNGGSDFNGLKQLSAHAIQVFHLNDYPADPPRGVIRDSQRVYPGDGIAPLTQIIRDLHANHCHPVLSIELFNPEYWKQDALEVAKTGLAKMKAAVNKALNAG